MKTPGDRGFLFVGRWVDLGMDEKNIAVQLDIKINDYPIIIEKELDTVLLEKCNYLESS